MELSSGRGIVTCRISTSRLPVDVGVCVCSALSWEEYSHLLGLMSEKEQCHPVMQHIKDKCRFSSLIFEATVMECFSE